MVTYADQTAYNSIYNKVYWGGGLRRKDRRRQEKDQKKDRRPGLTNTNPFVSNPFVSAFDWITTVKCFMYNISVFINIIE